MTTLNDSAPAVNAPALTRKQAYMKAYNARKKGGQAVAPRGEDVIAAAFPEGAADPVNNMDWAQLKVAATAPPKGIPYGARVTHKRRPGLFRVTAAALPGQGTVRIRELTAIGSMVGPVFVVAEFECSPVVATLTDAEAIIIATNPGLPLVAPEADAPVVAEPATPPSNALADVALTLTIGDTSYDVTPLAAAPLGIASFRLERLGGKGGTYDVDETLLGATCTCPDFVYRRDGLDHATGCKHIQAARKVGLIGVASTVVAAPLPPVALPAVEPLSNRQAGTPEADEPAAADDWMTAAADQNRLDRAAIASDLEEEVVATDDPAWDDDAVWNPTDVLDDRTWDPSLDALDDDAPPPDDLDGFDDEALAEIEDELAEEKRLDEEYHDEQTEEPQPWASSIDVGSEVLALMGPRPAGLAVLEAALIVPTLSSQLADEVAALWARKTALGDLMAAHLQRLADEVWALDATTIADYFDRRDAQLEAAKDPAPDDLAAPVVKAKKPRAPKKSKAQAPAIA